jgi:hypothetical protein
MKRRILHFFVATSLLLCLGTAILWAYSYKYGITLNWSRRSTYVDAAGSWSSGAEGGGVGIVIARGRALYSYKDFPEYKFDDDGELHVPATPSRRTDSWEFSAELPSDPYEPFPESILPDGPPESGFYAFVHWKEKDEHLIELEVPLYALTLAFALLPGYRVWRRFRRPRAGNCQTCGYDLRATPGRCPECGTARAAE